jgi:exodeoxyribonuclease-3
MLLATWNVNGIRARLDFVLHWLRARQPDVVGLQELKVTDEQFPRAEIESAGYRVATHGQKAWNGVAILSRTPAEITQTGLPGQEDFGARLLTADVGGVSFTTIYCPNGKGVEHADFPRKLAWLDALAAHFDSVHDAGKPAVLCGDFNICPAPLDSWNEQKLSGTIFHTDEERARYRRLLEWGFHDTFREKHPDVREFSWWDYRGGSFHRGLGLRIDFVLASRALMDRVRAVQIDREYRKKQEGMTPSDHAPVMVEVADAAAAGPSPLAS